MFLVVQCLLLEYDFRVTNLFVDLQDGVRLGRIVQLLLQDSSILTVGAFFFFLNKKTMFRRPITY